MCVYAHISFNVILHIFVFLTARWQRAGRNRGRNRGQNRRGEAMDGDNLFILAIIK